MTRVFELGDRMAIYVGYVWGLGLIFDRGTVAVPSVVIVVGPIEIYWYK